MKINVDPLFIYLLVMLAVMLPLACTTSGANDSKQSSSFTNRSWEFSSLTVSPALDWDLDGKMETDILAKMEDCEQDDLLLLRNDNTIVRNIGKLKCDEEDEQEKKTGSWSYHKASKKLTLNEDNEAQELTVVECSTSRLVLTYTWKATNGKLYQMTAVYH